MFERFIIESNCLIRIKLCLYILRYKYLKQFNSYYLVKYVYLGNYFLHFNLNQSKKIFFDK